jgi:TRAP-type transport system periplasmic protein
VTVFGNEIIISYIQRKFFRRSIFMKKVNLILSVLLVAILAIALVIGGCAQPAPAPKPTPSPAPAPTPEKTWTLKFSIEQPETAPYNKYGWVPWSQAVEKATNGRVKTQIYPMQTLVKSVDAWNGVQQGLADIAFQASVFQPGRFDLYDAIQMPFTVPDATIGSKVAWGLYTKFPELQALFTQVKLLSIWTTDPYMIVSRQQIKTLEDLKGKKIRSAGKPGTDMMTYLGGTPVGVSMADTYTNLEKGVLDGACQPHEAYIGFKCYEVAPFVLQVNTPANLHFLILNKDKWNEMPKDVQDAIMSVSGEYGGANFFGGGTFDRIAKEAPDVFKAAGKTITYYKPPKEEMDRWIDIGGKPVWADWIKTNASKGPSQAIFDETMRLVDQFSKK